MNKLKALQHLLNEKQIDAFLIPRTDEFLGEFVAPYAERLRWLTEFKGSSGTAVVTAEKAAFFTDGRYVAQATREIGQNYEVFNSFETSPGLWLSQTLSAQQNVGYDPWLLTNIQLQKLKSLGLNLKAIDENLIDILWEDQPHRPTDYIKIHPLTHAGETHQSKLNRVAKTLNKDSIDKVFITRTDSLSWLLNIRGNDVPYTPLVQGYLLLDKDGTFDLFVNLEKINSEVYTHLSKEGRLIDIGQISHHLSTLSSNLNLQIEEATCPAAIIHILEKSHLNFVRREDPCQLPKAIKNTAEVEGARLAHIEDGIALCRFFKWLEDQPLTGETTELSASHLLHALRKEGREFKDLSFESISGYGPNSSLIHYQPEPSTDTVLKRDSIYLLDSGGQYLGGTTDVTRTIALSIPTVEQKDRFTRVLKAHIAIASSRFPKGTSGLQLDALARQYLWQLGLDYEHGTGHGVGSYLSVHEGPQGISRGYSLTPLEPGMIISNEPGYYKTGEYGIRIESLVVVVEDKDFSHTKPFLTFETLTLAPIDTRLIEVNLLTIQEIAWVNHYHQQVFETLSSRLDAQTQTWLKKATQAI